MEGAVVACNCLLPLVEGAGETVGAAVVNKPSCNRRLASDGAGDVEGAVVACNCLLPLVEGAGETVGAAVVNKPSCNRRLASDGAGDVEGVVVTCNCLEAEPTIKRLKFA